MTDNVQRKVEVLSGPVLVRMLNSNIIRNLRDRTEPSVTLPTLVTLARDVVEEDRLVILHTVRRESDGQ